MARRTGVTGLSWWSALVGCCFCFLAAAAFWAGAAAADEPLPYVPPETVVEPEPPEGQPACPAPEVEPFEGEDAAAAEVRLLRAEAAQSCAALSARLDRIRERTWWVVAEALAAFDQRQVTNEKLTALVDSSCSNPCSVFVEGQSKPVEIEAGEALPVDEGESTESIVSAVDASGEAGKVALWFIAGLLVSGVVAYVLVRTVDRGT